MKCKRTIKRTLGIAILAITGLFAHSQSIEPQVIGSSGEFFTSANSQLSWTCGEVMIETVSSTNSIITQGFQQPDSIGTGVAEPLPENVVVNLYPNPTQDRLIVELIHNEQPLVLTLHDLNGKLLRTRNVPAGQNRQELNLSSLVNGPYLLNLLSADQQHSATYKIQKLK